MLPELRIRSRQIRCTNSWTLPTLSLSLAKPLARTAISCAPSPINPDLVDNATISTKPPQTGDRANRKLQADTFAMHGWVCVYRTQLTTAPKSRPSQIRRLLPPPSLNLFGRAVHKFNDFWYPKIAAHSPCCRQTKLRMRPVHETSFSSSSLRP